MLTFKEAIETTRKELETTGAVANKILFDSDQGTVMMGLAFDSNESKHKIQEELNKQFRGGVLSKVKSYIYTGEAWMSKNTKDMPAVPPSLRVDRSQIILVAEYNRNGKCKAYTQEFTIDNKRKIVTFSKKGDTIKGDMAKLSRMNFFIDQEDINHDQHKSMQKANKEFTEAIYEKIKKECKVECDAFMSSIKDNGTCDPEKMEAFLNKFKEALEKEKSRIRSNLYEDTEKNI